MFDYKFKVEHAQKMLEILENLRRDIMYHSSKLRMYSGICAYVSNKSPYRGLTGREFKELLRALMARWGGRSGDDLYPIPDPSGKLSAKHYYLDNSNSQHWDLKESAGVLRYELVNFCIKTLKEQIPGSLRYIRVYRINGMDDKPRHPDDMCKNLYSALHIFRENTEEDLSANMNGICTVLNTAQKRIVRRLWQHWHLYSGDSLYPVPSGDGTATPPSLAFAYAREGVTLSAFDKNGPYGRARWDLIDFLETACILHRLRHLSEKRLFGILKREDQSFTKEEISDLWYHLRSILPYLSGTVKSKISPVIPPKSRRKSAEGYFKEFSPHKVFRQGEHYHSEAIRILWVVADILKAFEYKGP